MAEAVAKLKFARISPRKVRLVTDLIRGKKVSNALDILAFSRKKSAKVLFDLVKSAVANAESTKNMDVDNLYISSIFVDGGPTMKRFLPRAMGRASTILKRTSHITVVLKEV
jgi:large subunit ribosomal protein L22